MVVSERERKGDVRVEFTDVSGVRSVRSASGLLRMCMECETCKISSLETETILGRG